jgi:phage FluMu gp28-like protein
MRLQTQSPPPPTLCINLPPLHPGQCAVAFHPARFRVLSAGRRWGKTRLGALLCLTEGLRGRRAWWVAPSYPVASIGWREIKQLVRQLPSAEIKEVERLVLLPGGGTVQVKSADTPDSLRGEGLNFCVLDECAFMHEDAWTHALRPALADRKGRALFISTPKGRNWYWGLWQRGQAAGTEWQSWCFPTVSNPFIDPAEVAAARTALPEQIYLQEFEAAFLEDAGVVFRRVTEAATAVPQTQAQSGHHYVLGCDWGRVADATVFAVFDVTARACVALDRMTQIDYALQRARLQALTQQFAPVVIVAELNSMGGPQVEELQRDGLPIQGFTTTNASKAEIIQALALAFERGEIRIPPDPVLLGELQAFASDRLPSGLIRYAAPEGMHDDTVIALALAWWAAKQGSGEPRARWL